MILRYATERNVPGGWKQFVIAVSHARFCCDRQLACVAFKAEDDARSFVLHLRALGLHVASVEAGADLAIADQTCASLSGTS